MYFCFLFHKNSGSFSFLFRQTLQHPCPLQWKCRVLTTGLPGKSLVPFQYHFTAFILSANKLEWTCLLFTFYCIYALYFIITHFHISNHYMFGFKGVLYFLNSEHFYIAWCSDIIHLDVTSLLLPFWASHCVNMGR